MTIKNIWFAGFLSIFIFFSLIQTSGAAEKDTSMKSTIAVGGGLFSPFEGQGGPSIILQAMVSNDSPFRIGFELEYSDYEVKILGVEDVETQSISLRGLMKYYFFPVGFSPYVGGAVGLSINNFDEEKINRSGRVFVSDGTARGIGFLGLIGLEMPLHKKASFFVETRVALNLQMVKQENAGSEDDVEFENLGGISAVGGLLIKF